jgi:threonine/homoserine/homoserine lactone efflux protein
MIGSLAAFAVLSLIVAVTPGPDSLLVLRAALLEGRRGGARVAGGPPAGRWPGASARPPG